MSNCIDAIDGKHIVIHFVPNSGYLICNNKGSCEYRIVLVVLVDSYRIFIYINIGCNCR